MNEPLCSNHMHHSLICSTCVFQWECCSHTSSSQALFINVFYMYFTWICNANVIMCFRTSNAFLNFFLRKKQVLLIFKLAQLDLSIYEIYIAPLQGNYSEALPA